MKTVVAIAMLAAMAASPVYADGPRGVRDPGVNARQHHQQARIRQGVRSGELTRREVHQVREGQRDIRQLERAYKSDGSLTRTERKDLKHEQNQASRSIWRQKHDRQQR